MPDKKPTSRRDFLRGHGIARTLLDAARGVAGTAASSFDKKELAASSGNPAAVRHRSSTDVAHIQTSRRAMACEFAIEYHAADGADAAAAAEAMRRILLDRARGKRQIKRGGAWQRIRLDQIDIAVAEARRGRE